MWLDAHSEAVEASLDQHYRRDLKDWYRGLVTARWLYARLVNLPADSALVTSVALAEHNDAGAPIALQEQPAAMPWPPTDLSTIPVAKSMAQVGDILSGADLSPHVN